MADLVSEQIEEQRLTRWDTLRLPALVMMTLAVFGTVIMLAVNFYNMPINAELLTDSTLGELAIWMAEQSTQEAPQSVLGRFAKDWAAVIGMDGLDEAILMTTMKNILVVWCESVAVLIVGGLAGLVFNKRWSRQVLMSALIVLDGLLFFIPFVEGDSTLAYVMAAILLLLFVLHFAAGKVTRVIGFVVILSAMLVTWEAFKSFAASNNYNLTIPVSGWTYDTYPTLEEALAALESGQIVGVIADKNDFESLITPYPASKKTDERTEYPNLRNLDTLDRNDRIIGLPIKPDFPGRLSVVVRADDAQNWTSARDFVGQKIATVEGDYADISYLSVPRQWVLIDLRIANDLNLPHLQTIAEAFFQPARRNGPLLLIRILAEAGIYTWGEAIFGFVFGATLGFLLGTMFAHFKLMERGLLPYVVASQTVPILAIAPMVVIWLGAGPIAVSVIAAYLTFFPVTINTLRGLQSPNPMAVELMQSYAADKWTIMWKLRLPAALPYIFTALKNSATASVVGAIIGELPSSIRDGLARAILDFSSDYSLVSTPKLWAAIVMAAIIGIIFFVIVNLAERLLLRSYIRTD